MKLFINTKHLLIPLILAASLIYVYGCGSNSVTNPLGGSSNVTFAISTQNGTQGVQFLGRSSVDVKLTRVISSLPANNFFDTVTNASPNYIFSKDSSYVINEFTGVTSGQKWVFYFSGTIASGGASYSATTNYTVP